MDQPVPPPPGEDPAAALLRALVVEEEAVMRIAVADLLAAAGFEVLEAWNAASALRQIARHAGIRLLVIGLCLSGARDGLALARAVAADWPEIDVMVVCGAGVPGADDLPARVSAIDKPLTREQARAAFRRLEGRLRR